jgi:hypothetical protein
VLWPCINDQIIYPGEVAGRSAETLDEADRDWMAPVMKTIGVVFVAAYAAKDDGASQVTITATSRPISSPASDDKRSY